MRMEHSVLVCAESIHGFIRGNYYRCRSGPDCAKCQSEKSCLSGTTVVGRTRRGKKKTARVFESGNRDANQPSPFQGQSEISDDGTFPL
jgi:hypothetical protein